MQKLNFLPILFSYYILLSPNFVYKDPVALVHAETCALKEKKVIVQCYNDLRFISPIFSVPTKEGGVRLIHNLKQLNNFVKNAHFMMESIHTVLNLVTQNCWRASLDYKKHITV